MSNISVTVSGGSSATPTVTNGDVVSVTIGNVVSGSATVASGTVTIGTVTTLAPGSQAYVTNVGTGYAAVLNIGLPAGIPGDPSSITFEIAAVNGLQSALDGKAAAIHTHTIGNVTGLQSALDGKAASSHQHAISDVNGLQAALNAQASASHTHVIADVTGLQASLDGKQASGTYATLVNGTVPSSQLPSYVDDVLEVSSLPGTGESGKIYIRTSDGKIFRWGGSTFVEIVGSPGSTDSITEGTTNLYFTNTRAVAAVQSALDGKAAASHTHTISQVTGLQAALDAKASTSHTHAISDVTNLEARLDLASTLTTAPASDTATGTPGQLALDSTYLYGCIAANTWRRIEWTAFGSAAGGITITQQPQSQSTSAGSPGTLSIATAVGTASGIVNSASFLYRSQDNSIHAPGSDYWNVMRRRSSNGTVTSITLKETGYPNAAVSHGEVAYSGLFDDLLRIVPHPYRHMAGNGNALVALKEEWNGNDASSPGVYSTTNGESWLDTNNFLGAAYPYLIGCSAVAASPNLIVAALNRGNWNQNYSYIYGERVFSTQPVSYTINGSSWSAVTFNESCVLYDIIYANGRFVAAGDDVSGSAAWWSSNGLAWTRAATAGLSVVSLAYGNGKIVGVGGAYPMSTNQYNAWWRGRFNYDDFMSQSRTAVVSSDNGSSWTSVQNALPTIENWAKVVFVGGTVNRFVAFSTSNQVAAVSADGVTWDAVFRPDNGNFFGDYAVEGSTAFMSRASNTGGYKDTKAYTFTLDGSGGGGSVVLGVSATASSGTLSYQWQKSTNNGAVFTDISGALAATLSLSGLTVSDSGSQYRCKLTAGTATVYSSAATITVTA